MGRRKIPEDTRVKLLRWSGRHCCFCGKACTTNIEFHHIDGDNSNNDEDNLIPVCFDCHGELLRYNIDHPKGTAYRDQEIKSRRNQVYDLHTRQYLRPVMVRFSKCLMTPDGKPVKDSKRRLGDTSCTVRSLSNDLSLRLRMRVSFFHNTMPGRAPLADLYTGDALWNLNPSDVVLGHLPLQIAEDASPFLYRIEVDWSLVDIVDREHPMLPFSYVWSEFEKDWWFDPRVHGQAVGPTTGRSRARTRAGAASPRPRPLPSA